MFVGENIGIESSSLYNLFTEIGHFSPFCLAIAFAKTFKRTIFHSSVNCRLDLNHFGLNSVFFFRFFPFDLHRFWPLLILTYAKCPKTASFYTLQALSDLRINHRRMSHFFAWEARWTICLKTSRKLPEFLQKSWKEMRVIWCTNIGLHIKWKYSCMWIYHMSP